MEPAQVVALGALTFAVSSFLGLIIYGWRACRPGRK